MEGIFAAQNGRVRAVALSGTGAPGITSGVLASLDAPAINAKGDIAFLATVRRGRETVEALLLSTRGRLQKIVAQGDAAPAGGTFAAFGPPTLDGKAPSRSPPRWRDVRCRAASSCGAPDRFTWCSARERHAHRWNLREVLGADRLQRPGHDRLSRPAQGRAGRRRDLCRGGWTPTCRGAAGDPAPVAAASRTSDCGPP